MEYISIQNAALASGKSLQTIRRMIKSKKILFKKNRTPQGFVYLISQNSLEKRLGMRIKKADAKATKSGLTSQPTSQRMHRNILTSQTTTQPPPQLEKFNTIVQKLIEQNERDKENFFNLIKSFQERVHVLENQIKLLEAPKKKWWRLW